MCAQIQGRKVSGQGKELAHLNRSDRLCKPFVGDGGRSRNGVPIGLQEKGALEKEKKRKKRSQIVSTNGQTKTGLGR